MPRNIMTIDPWEELFEGFTFQWIMELYKTFKTFLHQKEFLETKKNSLKSICVMCILVYLCSCTFIIYMTSLLPHKV